MAFEPGGYADKFGNRHEGRWVAQQLLRLLNENIRSVEVESIGDNEIGVDLWVQHLDGSREAQQCKARNGSKESWSIADLRSRGILQAMKFQLDRSPQYKFALVTGVPASVFGDICESARQSNGNPDDFYEHQILGVGQPRRRAFEQFCEFLRLDHSKAESRIIAFDYLQRTFIRLWPDDQTSWDHLQTFAQLLVSGSPRDIILRLADYAEENIRKILIADPLRRHLAEEGFPPQNLSHDRRIAPAVETLQQRFVDSIAPDLAAGSLIPRQETRDVFDALAQGGFVVLHGPAGSGKSSILYELSILLQRSEHPYIPIRLDRNSPKNTPEHLGSELGLPGAPSRCLASLVGDRFGVLILDQLDALRWTSQHSGNSLDVCKELVRQVELLRSIGKQVCVVMACRTFDLEHDPEIRKWVNDTQPPKWRKVIVKGLAEEEVKAVVEGTGHRFAALTNRQKQILQSPQHLGMWVKLAKAGYWTSFSNGVQLLAGFWESRIRKFEQAGLPSGNVDRVLDDVVGYMEHHTTLYAPEGLTRGYYKEIDILCSEDILQRSNGKLTFRHQSYLDYLIARRLLLLIYQGHRDVLQWLGPKENQSLFRREQLRQVLFLLLVQAPEDFLTVTRKLLNAPEIRFHLKHLVLEVIAEIEEPTPSLQRLLMEMIKDDYWRAHVLDTVLFGNTHHVRWLLETEVIDGWLHSGSVDELNSALMLLRSVNEKLSSELAQVLAPLASQSQDWAVKVAHCIEWRGAVDADEMFELRLELARRGLVSRWMAWQKLAENYPVRAVKLIEAILSTWTTEELDKADHSPVIASSSQPNIDDWSEEETEALQNAASSQPEITWKLLMPEIERLTADARNMYLERHWEGRSAFRNSQSTPVAGGIVQMAISAGTSLAYDEPERLLSLAVPYASTSSVVVQLIITEVYAELPPPYADHGIQWLISKVARFSLGLGHHEPKWMPAARLVQKLSPYCTDTVFEELEAAITYYHESDERAKAKHYLESWRQGYQGYFWGQAQYFLLPALSLERRSSETTELIRTLERKFGRRRDEWFLESSVRVLGGSVVSSIPSSRLDKISDRAWLKIVSSKSFRRNSRRQWIEISGHFTESSAEYFARDLETIAARYPERFGQLALQFPINVHPAYAAAVIGAMAHTTPPQATPDSEKVNWQPAQRETVEAVLARYESHDDNTTAMKICRLLEHRTDELWSATTVGRLVKYASGHPDPVNGRLNIYSDKPAKEASVENLFQNTINCVRGVAAHALAALMYAQPALLPQIQPAIDSLLSDPHPVVRMAAVEVCIAHIRVDKDQAVNWFLKAANDDVRVAASPRSTIIFNHTAQSHHSELTPLIRRMLASEYDDVAKQAASEVTARWIFYELFEDEVEQSLNGSSFHRHGVATVASNFVGKSEYSAKCRVLLERLLDDSDTEVLQTVGYAFNNPSIFSIPDVNSFFDRYLNSSAYSHNPAPVLHALERHTGSLLPYTGWILAICKIFSGPLRESSRDIRTKTAADALIIPALLLRLYDQAHERSEYAIERQCLDAWDMLFEERVGITRTLAKSIMQ